MILFDLSRLVSRAGRGTPTGIDRVELAYAGHLIRRGLPLMRIASVGQASAQALHPSGHLAASNMGRPRKRSGMAGGGPAGYRIVR